jgi:hypothetical protein
MSTEPSDEARLIERANAARLEALKLGTRALAENRPVIRASPLGKALTELSTALHVVEQIVNGDRSTPEGSLNFLEGATGWLELAIPDVKQLTGIFNVEQVDESDVETFRQELDGFGRDDGERNG